MTVPMNNTLGNSSRERAQLLYNKNVELESKRRKAAQVKIPSDPNAWQQMRENYESILLEDHAFSEQHDIEYALWQLHYKRIEELRAHYSAAQASAAQNGKGPARPGPDRITKIRSQFKTFLSEATGFYHDLMVKIRAKYGLSLGYMSDDPQNDIALSSDGNKSVDMKKGLISCHRCFIYLGDLARYKGLYGEGDSKTRDFAAASSYYKQAATLWPSSGNPHHQLAILASYSGDELLAVYRYFRSLVVDTPFTTARDNLIIAFEKNRQSYCQLLGDTKAAPTKKAPARMTGKGRNKGETRVSLKDRKTEPSLVEEREPTVPDALKAFSIRFVRLNGILFTRTSLETFGEVFSLARNDFLQLLSSGRDEVFSFGSDFGDCKLFITRFIAIMIFTVYNVNKDAENQSYAEILQRSVVLQNAFAAIFDFMALIVERCFQLNDPSASFLLPGIMIFVEWLACCQDIAFTNEMEEKQATARSLFWNHFVSFLNKILSSGSEMVNESEDEICFYNMSRYDESETANRLALPEDIELRGFLPLVPAHLILDFSRTHFGGDGGNKEKKARVQRIVAAGKALTIGVRVGQQGICFDSKSKRFFFGVEQHNADNVLLGSSKEISATNSMGQENHLRSPLQPHGEGEEEDEVIVFKPSVTEKHMDGFPSKLMSSEVIGNGANSSKVASRSNGVSVPISHGGFPLEQPASSVNGNMQYLQLAQTNTSTWMAGGEEFIENGLSSLNLLGTGFPTRSEKERSSGMLQSTSLSVAPPQSVGFGSCLEHSFQDPATVIPSKFDSVMTSAPSFDSIPSKTKSIKPGGWNKSPVSRPIRHFGPPPGFNTSAPKYTDESLRHENPPMDDYSWLDGYQLPYSAYGDGFVQVDIGKQNGWLDYQIPEHSSLYQEPLQQLKKGNEQFVALPQQYQGQSLWESRFFV
ncbi:protein SMG7-like isoform X2 [Cynara cardunculus var. scolymus]|uniref:protein SMG7-like isoform X2 n=1 Tax=Cynara cardunculus var. scolymus TaxID=59895 RepID=UPI000D62C10D|nr:protein SMG7-like isoform X2 [Cynara cardunculus var. scolymus]